MIQIFEVDQRASGSPNTNLMRLEYLTAQGSSREHTESFYKFRLCPRSEGRSDDYQLHQAVERAVAIGNFYYVFHIIRSISSGKSGMQLRATYRHLARLARLYGFATPPFKSGQLASLC